MIFNGTAPVKGEVVDIDIENMASGGEGVGRCRGMAVFVPGTVPGEKVRVKLTTVKKTFARGIALKVLSAVESRVDYKCGSAKQCGGCSLQHIDYARQLTEKTNIVRANLERTGKLSGVDVRATIGMGEPWHYRNKVHFQVGHHKGKVVLGLYQEGTHELVRLYDGALASNGDGGVGSGVLPPHSGQEAFGCALVEQELNEVAIKTQEFLNLYNVPVYNWRNKKGFLRHVMLRRATATGEIMVVLVGNSPDWEKGKTFAEDLMKVYPDIKSVVLNVNRHHGRVVLGTENKILAGQSYITDRMLGLDFRITPSSFYQVNHTQTAVLYQEVGRLAALTGKEKVLDLYCGIGGIALHLASKAKSVFGVEIVGEAVETARVNATLNCIGNAEFITGDIERLMQNPLRNKAMGNPDVVILDPPRKGCSRDVLKGLSILAPDRIVYVSCNPSTLARDLVYLVEQGYKPGLVTPVDLFPQTAHVECVVLMSRVED